MDLYKLHTTPEILDYNREMNWDIPALFWKKHQFSVEELKQRNFMQIFY